MGNLGYRLNGFNVDFDFHGTRICFNSARVTSKQLEWFDKIGLSLKSTNNGICVFSYPEKKVYFGKPSLLPNSIRKTGFDGWDINDAKYCSGLAYHLDVDADNAFSDMCLGNCLSLRCAFEGSNIRRLNTSEWKNFNTVDLSRAFRKCLLLESIDVSGICTSKCRDLTETFAYCENAVIDGLEYWDTHNVVKSGYMFEGCERIRNLDLSLWNTQFLEVCNNMFYMCTSLQSIDISNWDFRNVKRTQDLIGLFDTCVSLKYVKMRNCIFGDILPVDIFNNCGSLKEIDLSGCTPEAANFIASQAGNECRVIGCISGNVTQGNIFNVS